MSEPEERLLLIADLSGYTGYLVGGEAEEAPLIAGDLVETVVNQLSKDFELSGLEGDAAFVHGSVAELRGQRLLDVIGDCDAAFRRRIESVRQATTCTCEACRTAPTLDLKFFVHVGMALQHRIAGRDELAGRDVILVHRLMKDSEPAALGLESYALLTEAARARLEIDAGAAGLRPVRQTYDHFGEVEGWVGNPATWSRRLSLEASDDTPILDHSETIPADPAALWDLLTVPDRRAQWEGIEQVEELGDGARGLGSLSRCVARRLATMEEIVEWRPPVTFARRTRLPDAGDFTVRYDLDVVDGGTHLRLRWHASDPDAPLAREAVAEAQKSIGRLRKLAGALSR